MAADDDERRQKTSFDIHSISLDIAVLKTQVEVLKEEITKLVSKLEFAPVKLLVYAMAGMLLAAIIGAIAASVLRHTP